MKKQGNGLSALLLCLALLLAVGLGALGLSLLFRDMRVAPSAEGGPLTEPVALAALGNEQSATEIYRRFAPGCVGVSSSVSTTNIFGQVSDTAISGSGFLIHADGWLLTNYHVVQRADAEGLPVEVMLQDGRSYPARIVGGDEENDVALLKLDATELPTVPLGSFAQTQVGETVYVIGNPLGELSYSMTSGIVSALERQIRIASNTAITMFQLDAAINSGNSGGPVLNSRGEVIGIASAKYAHSGVEGLGFAIPIDDALAVAEELRQFGYVRGRPLMGIQVVDDGRGGLRVYSVSEHGSGAAAGLRPGDRILAMDDAELHSSGELAAAKLRYRPGDRVKLRVIRGGDTLELELTFGEKGAAD